MVGIRSFAVAFLLIGVAMAQFMQMPTFGITLDQARAALQASMNQAKNKHSGIPFTICVMDTAAQMKAYVRLDDVAFTLQSVACMKAKSALQTGTDTSVLHTWTYLAPGQFLFHFEEYHGRFVSFAGGVLIRDYKGMIIGAIGASGSFDPMDDDDVARAGATAVTNNATQPITTPLVVPANTKALARDSLMLSDAVHRLELSIAASFASPVSSAISVLDQYSNLVCHHFMDGTFPVSMDLSNRKGITSLRFDVNSKTLEHFLINTTGRYYLWDYAQAPAGYFTTLDGGVLFVGSDGKTIGSVSSSGASSDATDKQVAMAGASGASTTARKAVIGMANALQAIQSALNSAAGAGYRAAAVVLDTGGNLVAYVAMDGVAAGAFDICVKKAKGAAFAALYNVFPAVKATAAAYTLHLTNDGMVLYAGGDQLILNNQFLGTIGIWTSAFTNTAIEDNAGKAANADFAAGKTVAPSAFTIPTCSDSNPMYGGELITLSQALATANGVLAAAQSPIAVAIRDGRGALKLLIRQDNALMGQVDLAMKTSEASYLFPYVSEYLQRAFDPATGALFTAEISNGGIVAVPGGAALLNSNGAHVASVGVSLGLVDSDANRMTAQSAGSFFMAAGGSSVGVMSTADNGGTSYKTSFVAALVILLVLLFFGLIFVCYQFLKKPSTDQGPAGYNKMGGI